MTTDRITSGVDDLIRRLRQEGVATGKTEAEEILEHARRQAEQRLEHARLQAEQIVQKARDEASHTKRAGEEAVRLAVRDAMLSLKADVARQFADRLRHLVSHELRNEDFLKQLILEVAGRAAPSAGRPAQILLPNESVGLEELRRNPEEAEEGALSHYVVTIMKQMLRDGMEVGTRDDDSVGIRVALKDDDIEIDLTDQSIADLLLRHLTPRFRALMEGVVQ